jgi:hypothetical protein
MAIELKHLAPYLPYKLKVKHGDDLKTMNTGQGSSKHWIGIGSVVKWHDQIQAHCHPVLYPLSMWNKECEIHGDTFVPYDRLKDVVGMEHWGRICEYMVGIEDNVKVLTTDLPYWYIENLIKWHFDVFGLIDEGKAIDKSKV